MYSIQWYKNLLKIYDLFCREDGREKRGNVSWRKATKHKPVEENNMIAREFQREKRVWKVNVFPRGITSESYPVLQSVLSKNTNAVSGDRRLFPECTARNSKVLRVQQRAKGNFRYASDVRANTQRIMIPSKRWIDVKLTIEREI